MIELDGQQWVQFPVSENEKQQLQQQLVAYINELITTDFNRLLQVLYKVDIDEQKLKTLLREQPQHNAAALIGRLIWAREEEKAQSRRQFANNAKPDNEERW